MPTPLPPSLLSAELLPTLLDISITGVVYYLPVRDAAGQVVDLAFEYVNPAAQRQLHLSAQPASTYLQQFPSSVEAGAWAFHREALLADEPRQLTLNYQANGYDNYYLIAAQRVGEGLLVSFTDTNEHAHTPVGQALRESRAREQQAQAQAERQRGELRRVFEQAPVAIAVYRGPTYQVELANPTVCRLWGRTPEQVVGRGLFEALPEVAGMGYEELLDHVMATGQPHVAHAMEAQHERNGRRETVYWDFVYTPMSAEDGSIDGVMVVANEVTEQVGARRQLERLNEELEARVHARTHEAQVARAEAERQRGELQRIFEQAPVAIAVFRGAQHTIELANELQLAIWDRTREQALGRGLFELLPEVAGQGFEERLTGVLATGEPFVGTDLPASYTRHGVREQIFVSFVYTPLREADGRISGVVVVVANTTEQVGARRQLERLNEELEARVQERTQALQAAQAATERERAQLQALFAQAPVAIALFQGPEVRITSANARMAALWGRTPEQAVGRPLLEAVPELQGQGFDDMLRQVQATRVPYVGTEAPATIRGSDGELAVRYYSFSCQPLYDTQGEVLGIINVGTEVTEQVGARRQLERLNEELESRVQQRTRDLAEQQSLLRQILGQVPAAIVTVSGPEHRFTFFNEAYQALWGQPAELGRPLAGSYPAAMAQGFAEVFDRVYATGQPAAGTDTPLRLLDAATGQPTLHYIDYLCQPLFDGQRRVQGVLAFGVAVTEKVLARQQADTLQAAMLAAARRQAQQREELYQVFEQAPAAIMLLREPSHRVEYVNPAYARLFPAVKLRGRLLAEVHPQLAGSEVLARFDRVYETGETYVGEEEPMALALVPGQPPETRYFNYTYQPYRELERTVGVSVFAYDVTEQVLARRAASRQRQAQQAELQRIFEQAPVGIYLMRGPQFVIELINETAANMWGTVPATMLRRSWLDIAPGLRGSELLAAWERMLQTGEPHYQHEVRYQLNRAARGKPDAGYFNVAYQPWRDEQNQLVGIIAVGIEVTEQVLARQQVQALNDELTATNARLTHTNADLDTFVYIASHDLKTPIANIEGLLNALRDYLPAGSTDPLVPRLLDMMRGAITRFQQTISHLTSVSRLQHADAEPAQTINLVALVEDVRLDLAALLASSHAQLVLDVAQCPTAVFAPRNLRSIVYNLLSNALKYHDPARPALVQLRVTCLGGSLVLAVQDNGLGLSETQQGNLFTLFRRLHAHIEGSGVGLYMLKRIVENAGGTIEVQSQPGVGSTFTVTLPSACPPA